MHVPVLKEEVLRFLDIKPNKNFIDCTAGEGGHTLAILGLNGPKGRVLAIDRDVRNISLVKEKAKEMGFGNRLVAVNGNYIDIESIVERYNFRDVSGIVFDLGLSSWHIDESGRGFTFTKNEFLDMRYSANNGITAWEIVNYWPEEDIVFILLNYGEENMARKIAKDIVAIRKVKKIDKSNELSEIVYRVTKSRKASARVFQALRIAVNDELENVSTVLPLAFNIIKPGGRLAVISFHSLEDRIVKKFFKDSKANILTKKPIIPSVEELKINPRSRSAKLRALIKPKQ
ncbi:MAG: Ribosomal RNA small subunit methyltransferase H [Parcubacteria group bacterium ADurb.Bin247]|jgi:16S rRNA (cytosine1402-N4)-methyltransferase|nr:MAG: Ribosomal RNA small subunit methyltransferase H [Parcubacteria group bacterium ADurb.Bin247]HQB85174.1 16S rRNA (cytosine(1402)-N(4))-methyltransferase RsmH [Candidatus Pacearchaeota archaeon]